LINLCTAVILVALFLLHGTEAEHRGVQSIDRRRQMPLGKS